MGYVFDFKDSQQYERWFERKKNVYRFDLEMSLMLKMLAPKPGSAILDIGCGTGRTLAPLLDLGIELTGIDPSPYMLDLADERLGQRADLYRAFAEQLPFEDNTFTYSFFFTSLEFTEMPAKAIEEACRVTKDKVFIGVLNSYAPLNLLRRVKNLFSKNIHSQARYFSLFALRQITFDILGDVPIQWKTTLQFPFSCSRVCRWIEQRDIIEKSPFGTIIGMTIIPIPKFTTRPLSLRTKGRQGYGPVTGFAMNKQRISHEDVDI